MIRALTAISLLFFLTFATLWVRSYFVSEIFQRNKTSLDGQTVQRGQWNIASGRGGIFINRSISSGPQQGDQPTVSGASWQRSRLTENDYGGNFFERTGQTRRIGFGYAHSTGGEAPKSLTRTSMVFPYALPVVFCGCISWVLTSLAIRRPERKIVKSTEFADNSYLEKAA